MSVTDIGQARARLQKPKPENEVGLMYCGYLFRVPKVEGFCYRFVIESSAIDELTVFADTDDPVSFESVVVNKESRADGILFFDMIMKKEIVNHMIFVYPEEHTLGCMLYTTGMDPDSEEEDSAKDIWEWSEGVLMSISGK